MKYMNAIILSGIPTAGKSTWAKGYKARHPETLIISKDLIRTEVFEQPYEYSVWNEQLVDKYFMEQVRDAIVRDKNVILDNTHCRTSALIRLVLEFQISNKYDIYLKFFDISLFKAYYRNIIRKLKTGKWVPPSYIRLMYRSYKKIKPQLSQSSTLKNIKCL